MAEKSDYTEFKNLLRMAIGPDRTQSDFAKEADIDASTLSRLLNLPQMSQPSMTTLRKIAGHADGGITLYTLMEACGYEPDKISTAVSEVKSDAKAERESLNPNDRAAECVKDFRTGIEALAAKPCLDQSLYSFVDTVNMIYGIEDVSISIDELDSFTKSEKYPAAENASIVTVSYSCPPYSVLFAFILFYSETKKGRFLIFGAAFDGKTLLSYDSEFAQMVSQIHVPNGSPKAEEREYITIFRSKKKQPSRHPTISFTETPEQRLMRCIFGEDPDGEPLRTRPCSIEGNGFYIDHILDYSFVEFIEKHKKVFCKSDKEKEYYEAVVTNRIAAPKKYFDDINYRGDTRDACSTGWGSVIANIIYRETNISVEYYADDNEDYDNRPSVMFTDKEPWLYNETERNLSHKSFIQILDAYARELRCEVSECYWLLNLEF